MGCIGSRHSQDLQVTHSLPLDVDSDISLNPWNWLCQKAVFNCPDNLDGDVHTKVREILPELNKILDKTSFYPCRLFICALLKSLGTCFTAACIAIVIQLLFLGEDVHEGKTGLPDVYKGGISQLAPEDEFFILRRLQQVDPAHNDKDCCTAWWEFNDVQQTILLFCFGWIIFFYLAIDLAIDKILSRKWQLNNYVERWNSRHHHVKLSLSDDFYRAMWDHRKTGYLRVHVLDGDGETQRLCSSNDNSEAPIPAERFQPSNCIRINIHVEPGHWSQIPGCVQIPIELELELEPQVTGPKSAEGFQLSSGCVHVPIHVED